MACQEPKPQKQLLLQAGLQVKISWGGGGLNILLRAQWRETYQVGEGAPAYTAAGSKISLQHQEEVEPDENRALQMLTQAPPPPIVNYFRESQHQSKEVSGTK